MARGEENQPKHAPPGGVSTIVLWEQESHRDVSKSNGEGFTDGRPGPDWQSHHIVCISSMASRQVNNPTTKLKLEQSLYITDWNINEKPNMIGLPMRCQYRLSYGAAEDATLINPAAGAAAWGAVKPVNKPSHSNDHPSYTAEVSRHLQTNIWDKFDADKGDHNADATWLKDQLEGASRHFQSVLLQRGARTPGTIKAWQQRFTMGAGWVDPFSMAAQPAERNAGKSIGDLTNIFQSL
jgi:hypothetical protein